MAPTSKIKETQRIATTPCVKHGEEHHEKSNDTSESQLIQTLQPYLRRGIELARPGGLSPYALTYNTTDGSQSQRSSTCERLRDTENHTQHYSVQYNGRQP